MDISNFKEILLGLLEEKKIFFENGFFHLGTPPLPGGTPDARKIDDCTKKKGQGWYCNAGSCAQRPAECGTVCGIMGSSSKLKLAMFSPSGKIKLSWKPAQGNYRLQN